MNEEMIHQLSVKEIDQIISFLQEPYPYELIKRLEKLKEETNFYNQFRNQQMIDRMNEDQSIQEHGLGTSPVSNAYFAVSKEDSMDDVVKKAKKYLDEIRNDLVIENCKREDKCDTEVLLTIIEINQLEKLIDRVHYNYTNDFVTRFKKNPDKCLHELRTERDVSNMFFDFVMDLSKVGLAEMDPNRTVKEISEFVTFWMNEHFKRGCDERKSGPAYRLTLEELAERYKPGRNKVNK